MPQNDGLPIGSPLCLDVARSSCLPSQGDYVTQDAGGVQRHSRNVMQRDLVERGIAGYGDPDRQKATIVDYGASPDLLVRPPHRQFLRIQMPISTSATPIHPPIGRRSPRKRTPIIGTSNGLTPRINGYTCERSPAVYVLDNSIT